MEIESCIILKLELLSSLCLVFLEDDVDDLDIFDKHQLIISTNVSCYMWLGRGRLWRAGTA